MLQRGRPMPLVGSAPDGTQPIRQRLVAAEGMITGSSPLRRQRLSISARVPLSSAAS